MVTLYHLNITIRQSALVILIAIGCVCHTYIGINAFQYVYGTTDYSLTSVIIYSMDTYQ